MLCAVILVTKYEIILINSINAKNVLCTNFWNYAIISECKIIQNIQLLEFNQEENVAYLFLVLKILASFTRKYEVKMWITRLENVHFQ